MVIVTGTIPVPTRILVLYFENDGNSHVISMCEVQVITDPGTDTFVLFPTTNKISNI